MAFLFRHRKTSVPDHPRRVPKYNVAARSDKLGEIFAHCSDYESRELCCGGRSELPAVICFLDGLTASSDISDGVIRPLTDPKRFADVKDPLACAEQALLGAVHCASVKRREEMDDIVDDLTRGRCALFFGKKAGAVTFEVRSSIGRSVEQPSLEKTVKGAKDSFVEVLRTNTALLRRKIRLAELKLVKTTVGRKTNTSVVVAYIDGVADPALVSQIMDRLEDIDIDGVLTAGNIEEYIADSTRSPFPQIHYTERPDRFAMNLLDGRVGLLVDGLPIGFMLPASFLHFLRVQEDNAQHFLVASGLRLLRYTALVIATLAPALFVAVAMYHQEMIPTKMLLSAIENKQQVPFPVAVEVTGMLVAFELLQEAGLRLPNPVGETVSIIGALIVGQSAVEARVISPIVVIIVAFAGISGYTMPNQDLGAAIRLLRFVLTLFAILLGLFGVAAGSVLVIWHLCSLDSFGRAYMSPLVGDRKSGGWLELLRLPLKSNKLRDRALNTPDKRSQK